MSSKSNPNYSAPALEKGLDIIELLSAQETGLTQSEIARGLGRSVGEIFRMLIVLQDRGFVAQDPLSDRYSLTTYIFEIAHRIPVVGRLTAAAGPPMRELSAKINQSAHLSILSGTGVLVIGQTNSPGNNVMAVRLGAQIDLWRASSGRVILAYQPKEEVRRLMKEVPIPKDSSAEQILEELAQIRAGGLEVRDSFVVRGVVNISVPIIDHSGQAVAALTIPHIERYGEPISFETCKSELAATAALLSKTLGGQPPEVS
ncbi:IclR family transcriptional regulator [Mameliella sediminis]|uniref:IclR family transcriptional regulator n=1 Tax=Mameliella sediminis TaxID=2836866 RepID=UPI001C446049|nr:IclR family transcriptional regulator [Mameliella sediminis]MBY6116664.1 IclR family transcriptional regulator [Antarctobacter heliothermus]MBY6146417.1 IclR family transcriptional regulator [Mameliella alba]MBY6163047.1 IclR family transcriptional regulator [Mameliella alba]MBY6171311.1 IclR family transcriptional regulator [Mameliella alba]